MTKFKIGDKVRVTCDREFVPKGTVLTVSKGPEGDDWGGNYYFEGYPKEISYCILGYDLELAADKPTKNQRIFTLEQQVETLTRRIEALEQGTSYTHTPRPSVEVVKPLTPNQKRKAIIDEAKAFVESAQRKQRDGNCTTEGNEILRSHMTETEFIVNKEKRTVVALVRGIYSGDIYAKGIAKCAPDDVFNADIGKAIALGRALGLDVTRFEQAVQPTEVVVGHIVNYEVGCAKVARIEKESDYHSLGRELRFDDRCGWVGEKQVTIIDDTEAQYE